MNQFKTSVFILLLLLTTSCEKAVQDFDLKTHKPVIVLNALFQNDSALYFTIAKSAMRDNESPTKYMVNPSAIIFARNNELLSVKTFESGVFMVENIKAMQGDKFDMSVKVDGLKPVSASVRVPDTVSFNIKETKIRLETPDECMGCEQELYLIITLDIEEPSDSNYYAIAVESRINQYPVSKDSMENDFEVRTVFLPIESQEGIYEFYKDYGLYSNGDITQQVGGEKLFFRDNLLPGLKNTLNIKAYIGQISADSIPINVVLYTYSKSMYNHLKSISEYNQFGDSPFSDPIYIRSNINNGRGVLGAMSQTSKPILLRVE